MSSVQRNKCTLYFGRQAWVDEIDRIGYVVSPRLSPVINHVLKGIVIMFYRLVSQLFINWWLMCLLGQGA